ncbi:MAG: hypothetical protein BWY42_01297 [Candidatus Omnitrophica bacterium ADurb.Bin277]|nr:MAG: hypothetical protein BWY42_01297 [Candidatus Omnitrophica bacterium ADurb.Bin277]
MKVISFVLILSLVVFAPSGFAEWFGGEVAGTDLKAQELTITEIDPITEIEETSVIAVIPSTVFSGVRSLKDVRTGDEILIEAGYDENSDSWQAISVEVSAGGE